MNKDILAQEKKISSPVNNTKHSCNIKKLKFNISGLPLLKEELTKKEDEERNLLKSTDTASIVTGSKYLELIYTYIGYGKMQYFMILISFLIISLEGIHLYVTSALIYPFIRYYGITEGQVEFLSSIMFIGVGLGSFSLGFLNKLTTRISIVQISSFSLLLLHIIWTLTTNFYLIVILRVFTGYFIGILIPISMNILCEYLPIKYRCLTLTSVWLGFTFGQIATIANINIIMPYFEHYKTEQYLLSLVPFQIIVLYIIFTLLKDSPRNLLLNGKHKEAYSILSYMLKRELTIDEKLCLKSQKLPSNERSSYLLFYKSEYFNINIKTSLIGLIGSMLIYGPMLIVNIELTRESINNNEDFSYNDLNNSEDFVAYQNVKSNSILKMLFIVVSAGISSPIGGIITEIECLGRKKSCILAAIIGGICSTMIILYYNQKVLFNGGMSFGSSLLINVFSSYMLEIYPTKYRDIAVSFFYTSMRAGGFISQFLFVSLYLIDNLFPFYFCTISFIALVVLTNSLPYDTYGRPLD